MKYNNVTIPEWLDRIIFDDFRAVYEPRPMEVVYNPDQPYDFVKLYLGTYFPRSYAEAYGITSQILSIKGFKEHYINLEEINLLDFCCGTGGEIIGTIVALQSKLPNLKRVNVDAFDANVDAVRFLFHPPAGSGYFRGQPSSRPDNNPSSTVSTCPVFLPSPAGCGFHAPAELHPPGSGRRRLSPRLFP